MHWFKRVAQFPGTSKSNPKSIESWEEGEYAILSNFGWRSFSVVEILDWDKAVSYSDEFSSPDPDTITTTRGYGYTWKRDNSVPCVVIENFSESGLESGSEAPGKVHFVHPSNLYREFNELVEKEVKVVFPDLVISLLNKPHVNKFLDEFPMMRGSKMLTELVDFDVFDVQGYEVQVFNDLRAVQKSPGMMQTEGTEGMFYWVIPSLNVRSLEDKHGINKSPWGSGRYPTKQMAVERAEEYLDFMFYGGSNV